MLLNQSKPNTEKIVPTHPYVTYIIGVALHQVGKVNERQQFLKFFISKGFIISRRTGVGQLNKSWKRHERQPELSKEYDSMSSEQGGYNHT